MAEFALMSQVKGHTNIVSYEDHMVVQHEDGIGWDILIRMELLTPRCPMQKILLCRSRMSSTWVSIFVVR